MFKNLPTLFNDGNSEYLNSGKLGKKIAQIEKKNTTIKINDAKNNEEKIGLTKQNIIWFLFVGLIITLI